MQTQFPREVTYRALRDAETALSYAVPVIPLAFAAAAYGGLLAPETAAEMALPAALAALLARVVTSLLVGQRSKQVYRLWAKRRLARMGIAPGSLAV